jgi:hypothetical protein
MAKRLKVLRRAQKTDLTKYSFSKRFLQTHKFCTNGYFSKLRMVCLKNSKGATQKGGARIKVLTGYDGQAAFSATLAARLFS